MFYVYILQSKRDGRLYTGYTSDLKQRIKQHSSPSFHYTGRMGGFELVYYEAFKDRRDAIEREKYLKTTKGKRTLRIMLKYGLSAKLTSSEPPSSSLV